MEILTSGWETGSGSQEMRKMRKPWWGYRLLKCPFCPSLIKRAKNKELWRWKCGKCGFLIKSNETWKRMSCEDENAENAYFAYPYKKGDHHFYDPSPWSVMAIWSIRNEPQPWFLERFGRSLREIDWYLRDTNFGGILVLVTRYHIITAWYSMGNNTRKHSMMESNRMSWDADFSPYLSGFAEFYVSLQRKKRLARNFEALRVSSWGHSKSG